MTLLQLIFNIQVLSIKVHKRSNLLLALDVSNSLVLQSGSIYEPVLCN